MLALYDSAYLRRYLPLVPILVILANIPDYTLRLHHYIFTLAALPVLSLPNRVSVFGQAFAFGLFLDGVGRWGWDSILDSTVSVRYPFLSGDIGSSDLQLLGDANAGTGQPTFSNASTPEMVAWMPMNESLVGLGYEGISMLVDDIQRLVNYTQPSEPVPTCWKAC